MQANASSRQGAGRTIGYAVVGIGHIAQVAVLPAFTHAKRNSRLVAIVSDDARKRRELGRRYRVATYSYNEYGACLAHPDVDAVYIAVPNSLHARYAVRAAQGGVHVLCEKPMALDEDQCASMIRAARQHRVKLMIAYRLHFEAANLRAAEVVRSGVLGEPRIFNSVFGMQVTPGDVRLRRALGGGTLYDVGIYCINAARSLFRDEPIEVSAFASHNGDRRFREVDEMTSAILRFRDDRLACFTSSFGAADVAAYEVVGTKGRLRVEPAYEYAEGLTHYLTVNGREQRRTFPKRDQFAAELLYFSDCILHDREPEPSGYEGLADVRIIRALQRSAASRRPVKIRALGRRLRRPSMRQETHRPPVRKPRVVRARPPSR